MSSNPTQSVVKEIKRATRRKFTAEDKIRIVLEGLRGQVPVSEVCRREGIVASQFYVWSKAFLDAGKNGLTLDTRRDSTSDEVRRMKEENEALRQALAQNTLEILRYKKNLGLL
jgi:transposase